MPSAPQRVLRRSRTDRVASGVAGGLGEYFAVDPVLFRVLFATAAFFGGAGVLAYLLAWVAIPEQGTVNAPIDRFVSELRRRRVPVWIVALAGALLLWAVAFSWWAPGRFLPVIIVVLVLIAIFGRRARTGPVPPGDAPAAPVSLDKGDTAGTEAAAARQPEWVGDTRRWMAEARQLRRERRRRALPVRLATLVTLVVTLTALGIADALGGIRLPVYFWTGGAIVLAGLLVGVVLRRTPWSLAVLLLPALAGMIAFGNTASALHDGIGQREFAPSGASALAADYRLAFGRTVLDLSHLGPLAAARTVHVTAGAGVVRIIAPRTLNLTVVATVHLGNVTVDGSDYDAEAGRSSGGVDLSRVISPPAGATGAPLSVDVHLSDGTIAVDHTP
ncbi:MAG: PspC domain-containing protein [Jatrophihabitantaceae bacterium]